MPSDRERIAELEEQIRQMREAFAPTLVFPMTWQLQRCERCVLQALLARPLVTPEIYRHICEPKSRIERDDRHNLALVVGRVRHRLRDYTSGAQIKTRWCVGYYIESQDKQKIHEAIHDQNSRHNIRAVA